MANKVTYPLVAFFSLLSSSAVIAQSSEGKPGQTFPKQLYIEKYLKANPSLPATIEKMGANERFDFYKMPLDNMICAKPGNGFANHIIVYDPTIGADYPGVIIPNALAKGELIK